MKFFRITHNSFETRGFPWGQRISRGLELVKVCYTCDKEGLRVQRPRGEVEIELEPEKGTKWPDVLGVGHWPLFVISKRVIDHWRAIGISGLRAHPVRFAEPVPRKLDSCGRDYWWLDGAEMSGAKLDFDASGFVGVSFCPNCGTRSHDIDATYDRQHSATWPMAFVKGSWTGADLFTTDLSPTMFFCTEKIVEAARREKHSNFLFVPAEVAASSTKGIKYVR